MRPGVPTPVLEKLALAGVAGLILLLAAGAAWAGRGEGFSLGRGRCDGIAARKSLHSHPAVTAAPQIFAIRRFPHDKRQPRAPRHRSERPNSFSAGRDLTSAVVYSITHDDVHRPLMPDVPAVSPLSGHPLELLRPPSVRA